jgi:hypothetical protein
VSQRATLALSCVRPPGVPLVAFMFERPRWTRDDGFAGVAGFACFKGRVQPQAVNWLAWSVFMIWGGPDLWVARFKTSRLASGDSLSDMRWAIILRGNQSTLWAPNLTNPWISSDLLIHRPWRCRGGGQCWWDLNFRPCFPTNQPGVRRVVVRRVNGGIIRVLWIGCRAGGGNRGARSGHRATVWRSNHQNPCSVRQLWAGGDQNLRRYPL